MRLQMNKFSFVSRTLGSNFFHRNQFLLCHLKRCFSDEPLNKNISNLSCDGLPRPIYHKKRFHNPWKSQVVHDSVDEQTNHTRDVLNKIEHTNIEKNIVTPNLSKISQFDGNGILASWIGHSTTLIQMDGLIFLTDPIWSQICSPIPFFSPKRLTQPAIQMNDLPKIDFVVISHNHYDHLDYDTVKKIGDSVTWFVPLGLADWFKDCHIYNVIEMNWWDEKVFKNLKVVCTPAKHWSCRTPFDTNKSLWCSWTILGPNHRFFFNGDTAYCPVFKDIGNKYGPFDLAAIPIGAYSPRHILKGVHINPEEAVQIHKDLKSRNSFGIHWATFPLTQEKWDDPPRELCAAAEVAGLKPDEFFILKIGETWEKSKK